MVKRAARPKRPAPARVKKVRRGARGGNVRSTGSKTAVINTNASAGR